MDIAEDLTQDVFTTLWSKRKKVDKNKIVPLLYKIASNLFINKYRKDKRHLDFLNTKNIEKDIENPQYLLELKEFDNKLQTAIGNLPEKCRTIFLMNRIDKHSYSQIASIMSVSVKAIEKQMSKALGLLKEELKTKL
jgi:RNA polymerase sigma-70 factor (ECF subfamily)